MGLLVRERYDVKLLGTGVGEEGLEQDNEVEIMWVRLGRKKHADVLVGVVYITPQGLSKGRSIWGVEIRQISPGGMVGGMRR